MKRRPLSSVLALLTLAVVCTAGAQSVSIFNSNNNALGISTGSGNVVQRAGTVTSGTNNITGLASTVDLRSGMIVSGGGIPGGTVITAITSTTTLQISSNATNSSVPTLTFLSPWNFTRAGNVAGGVDTITNLLSTSDMVPGMKLIGNGITGVVTIVEILSPTSIRISAPAAISQTNQNYTFVAPTTPPSAFARAGTISSGSLNVITLTSSAGIPAGTLVTGPGLTGTVVVEAILSPTTVRLSAAASAAQSGNFNFNPVYFGPNSAGHTATINLDFSPGRSIGGITKDLATVVSGTTTYVGTLDSDPLNSSLNVNVTDASSGTSSFTWSQIRGSSHPSAYTVTFVPATREVTVTFANPADTTTFSGRVLRANYTRTTQYTNKQIGDQVDRVGRTDGTATTFGPTVLTHNPTQGSLAVSDGVFLWTDLRGSSNPKDFVVAWNPSTKEVTVTYSTAPPANRLILATYAHAGAAPNTLGTLFLGDTNGGEQIGLRLNQLNMQSVGSAQAQINKVVGGDDEIVSGLNLVSNTTLAVRTGGNAYDSFRIGGVISGTGNFSKRDSGNVTLMGTNTYTGNTFIATTGGNMFLRSEGGDAIPGGTIFLGNSNRDGHTNTTLQLEASDQIADSATVWFDGINGRHGYLKMMGNTETVARIIDYSGQGILENTESENGIASSGTLTVNGAANSNFNGFLRDKVAGNQNSVNSLSTGKLNLVQSGTGTLNLAGGQIAYTGSTTVNSGRLRLQNITNPLGNQLPPIVPGNTTTFYNANTAPRFGSDIVNNATVELAASTDWRFGKDISGAGAVVKTGNSTVSLVNGQTFTGELTVADGTLRLLSAVKGYSVDANGNFNLNDGRLIGIEGSGQLLNTPRINIAGGSLVIFNQPDKNENDNVAGIGRINDSAEIRSTGGVFNFNFDPNAGAASYSENVGALVVDSGNLSLVTSRAASGQTSQVSFESLSRQRGGTLNLSGLGVGGKLNGTTNTLEIDNRNRVRITTPPALSGGIIGGWMTMTNAKRNEDDETVNSVDFVRRDADGTLRAFTNYTVANSGSPGANQTGWTEANNLNVLMATNTTLSSNRFLNSLKIENNSSRTLNLGNPSRRLTIQSGGIIARGNNHTITNGLLTAGTAGGSQNELFVHVGDALARTLRIVSRIDDNQGSPVTLVKSGIGKLELTSAQGSSYTGGTIINQGVVEITSISALGGGNIFLTDPDFLTFNGGTIRIPSPSGGDTRVSFEATRGIVLGPQGGSFALNPNVIVNLEGPVSGPGEMIMGGAGGTDGLLVFRGNNSFTGSVIAEFGTVDFAAGTNVFTGPIVLNGGNVRVSNGASLPTKASVVINSGTFAVQDHTTIGALSGSGSVTPGLSTTDRTLTIDQESNTTYGGLLTDSSGGALNVVKTGNGVLRLSSAVNQYRGETKILGGVLAAVRFGNRGVSGSLGVGLGNVTREDPSAHLLLIGDGAALSYVGSTPSITNRPFTIGTGSLGAGIYANGARLGDDIELIRGILRDSNNLVTGYDGIAFSQPDQNATLILGGINGGENVFAHTLSDNGTGVLNLTKTGTGKWILGERSAFSSLPTYKSTYSGQTTIYAGTLSVISDTALGRAGGASVNLVGGNLDIETLYETPETLVMMGGRLRTMNARNGVASWAGDIRVDLASVIEVRDDQTLTVRGVVSGAGSLNKQGFGTLILTANNILRGSTTISEGILRLDFSTNSLSKLADGAGLTLGGGRSGGTLDIVGGTAVGSGAAREDVSSLTLSQGTNRITRSDPASTTFVRLNGFTINQGGALDFEKNNIAQLDRANLRGILGAWATVGSTDWASNARNGNDGNVVAFGTSPFPDAYGTLPSTYVNNVFQSGAQTNITSDQTVSNFLTNSLRFNSDLSTTLTLSGDNNIFSNGILQTPNVGTNTNLITGGRIILNPTREGGNLYVHQNNADGGLRIASEITNSPAINGLLLDYTSGSTTLTVAQGSTSSLVNGMPISGAGIPAGAVITNVGAGQIEISAPTTSSGSSVAPHVNGIAPLTVSFALGSATVNVTAGQNEMAGLYVGMPITHPSVPAGTIITAINYVPGGISQFTMSRNATSTAALEAPVFGGVNNLVVETTAGSGTLNIVSGSALELYTGMPVTGNGIPEGATITGFNNNNSFNISIAATLTQAAMTPTVSPRNGIVKAGPGILFLAGNNTFTGPVRAIGGTVSVTEINNALTPGPLGASDSSFNNLVLDGATLQYTGNSTTTDRGFKINESGAIDIALSGTRLTMEGNLSGGDGLAEGKLSKTGGGTLRINRTVLTGGALNIFELEVLDGALELQYANANGDALEGVNNRFASQMASVTMGGGRLELIGVPNSVAATGTDFSENRTQQLFGTLTFGAGASEIRVTGAPGTTTTLELQNPTAPTDFVRLAGAAANFVENPNGGTAIMRIAIPAISQSEPITWATYRNTSDLNQPGVNNFAAIEPTDDGVISADEKNLYRILPDAVQWPGASGNVVSEGFAPFSGVVGAAVTVRALRYFNPQASTVTVSDRLTISGGAILVGTVVGNTTKRIEGGLITSSFLTGTIPQSQWSYYSDVPLLPTSTLRSYDLIVHNYNPAGVFEINSTLRDYPGDSLGAPSDINGNVRFHPVAFVHAGDGTTTLSGTNTYTGTTYANSGTILLTSQQALPGGINTTGGQSLLSFDGGVIGLGSAEPFTRNLGGARSQVQWTGSGGFAAYGGNRVVNLGGAAAEVAWASGSFVPDGASLILGARDSNGTVRLENPVDLGGARRQFIVNDGLAEVDAQLGGTLSGLGGSLHKLGYGTLEVLGAGLHTRGTFLSKGTLIISEFGLGTGNVEIGTTSNTAVGDRLRMVLRGGLVEGQTIIGNYNLGGITTLQTDFNTTLGGGLVATKRFFAAPALSRTLNILGSVDGGAMTVAGGGSVAIRGAWTGNVGNSSDSNFDGGVIVRHGFIVAGATDALGTSVAVDLGDRFSTAATGVVHRAAGGRTVMATGGRFDPNSNGNLGSVNGNGAFVFANRNSLIIDGFTYGAADVGRRILVDGEVENPERNGIYEVRYFPGPTPDLADDIISLVRVADFDSPAEAVYGGRVLVEAGSSAGKTFYVATPGSVPNVTPILFREESSLNPNVGLLLDTPGITISNDVDINATIGSGTVTIGGALSFGAGSSQINGAIRLQDIRSGVAESKQVRLVSETSTGRGVVLAGEISEVDATAGTGDTLSVLKDGLGTVTLLGANTYRGGTIVNAGTLIVSNTTGSGTGSGNLVLNNPGTSLGGNGFISGNTTINAGGVLVPGDPTSGLVGVEALEFGGNLTLGNLSSLLFNLKSATDYDRVDVNGLLTAGLEVIIGVTLDYLPTTAAVFNLLDWGAISVTGSLSDGLDLPTLAASNLYWDTSLFDTQGVVEIKVNSGSGPPPISFAVREARVTEAGQTIVVAVQSSWPAPSNVTVPLIYAGTATRNADFTGPSSVVIPVGASSALVNLVITDDPTTEPEERIIVRIGNPTGGLKGTPASFTLTVDDNDGGREIGQQWVLRNPLPTNETLNDVAWSGSIAVAVGTHGTLMTSPDGITWTRRTLPVVTNLNAVTWTGEEWVVVGDNGLVMTSVNTLNWELRSLNTGADIYDVVWTHVSKLIAVGENGSLYVSIPDYATDRTKLAWTLMNTGTAETLRAVASNAASGFLAVGDNGTMVTSANALAWTSFTQGSSHFYGAAAKADLFVAAGVGGVTYTSADLLNWTLGSIGVINDTRDLHWTGSQFVASASGGVIRLSSDGSTWTSGNSVITRRLESTILAGSTWLSVGDSGSIQTSATGTAWTSRTSGPGQFVENVTRTASQFVAVGQNGNVLTSPDGITWTQQTSPVSQRLKSVASSGSIIAAVGQAGRIISSTNGTLWTQVTSPTGEDLNGIVHANSLFVAVGSNGAIITSSNGGSTWNIRDSTSVLPLNDVASSGTLFVAVGGGGTILVSADGIAWDTAQVVPSSAVLNDVTWTGSQFVAVGVGGVVLTSSDGQNWVRRISGTTSDLEHVISAGTSIFAVGSAGTILDSVNGSTWIRRLSGTAKAIVGIAFGPPPLNRLVAVGEDGTILTSDQIAAPPPQVFFTLDQQSVKEGVGTVNVVVNLNPVADVDVRVPLTITPGATPATVPADFTASTTPLVFKRGQSTRVIAVKVKNDSIAEADESFIITLGTPVALKPTLRAPVLSLPITHEFTILNDDAALAVLTPPVQQVVPVGAPIALNALVTGGDRAVVQWRRNNTVLKGAVTTATANVGEFASTFSVASAQVTNGGRYDVKVNNSAPTGSVTSIPPAELLVIDQVNRPVPVRNFTPAVIKVIAGGSSLTYQWFKDTGGGNILVSNGGNISGATSPTLTIANFNVGEEATYRCQVTCPTATPPLVAFSGDFNAKVAAQPDIMSPTSATGGTVMSGTVTGIVGTLLTFQVPFSAEPSQAPTSFASTKLPAGLKLDARTGIISGIPTTSTGGPVSVTVTANNPSTVPDFETFLIDIQPVPGSAIGSFIALAERNDVVNLGLGARMDVTTTNKGTFSGSLLIGTTRFAFKGSLNTFLTNPAGAVTIVRKAPLPSITLDFAINTTNNTLSGNMAIGVDTASISGWRNVWSKTTSATDYAGRHNVALDLRPQDQGDATLPQGTSYASIVINPATGVAVVTGKASDGFTIATTAPVGPGGGIAIYTGLYTNTGSFHGFADIVNDTGHTVSGTVTWSKNPQASPSVRLYRQGWPVPIILDVGGGLYTPPVAKPVPAPPVGTAPQIVLNAKAGGTRVFVGRNTGNSIAQVGITAPTLDISSLSVPTNAVGIAVDNTNQRVFWTSGNAIGVVNIDGTGADDDFITLTPGAGAAGIAVDVANGFIYWAQSNLPGSGAIMRANIDGTNVTPIISRSGAIDVALDVPNNRLYHSSISSFDIGRSELNGDNNDNAQYPDFGGGPGVTGITGLALDRLNGFIYWTRGGGIGRAPVTATEAPPRVQ
jgi:autotransporter-associated beta strand protein